MSSRGGELFARLRVQVISGIKSFEKLASEHDMKASFKLRGDSYDKEMLGQTRALPAVGRTTHDAAAATNHEERTTKVFIFFDSRF